MLWDEVERLLPMRKNFRAFFRRKWLLITNSSRNLLAALELFNLKVKVLGIEQNQPPISFLWGQMHDLCDTFARKSKWSF